MEFSVKSNVLPLHIKQGSVPKVLSDHKILQFGPRDITMYAPHFTIGRPTRSTSFFAA